MLHFLKLSNAKLLIVFIVVGQLVFGLFNASFTAPAFEGRIYATIGVELSREGDLHKLNEAAHYFGQTIIGWTKFPHFTSVLKEKVALDKDLALSAHMQERQNIVFILHSKKPIENKELMSTKNYLQSKLVEYNESSSTGFILSNLDYEMVETTRSYPQGAGITLALSLVLFAAQWYLRKEF